MIEPSRHDTHYMTRNSYWQSLYSQGDGVCSDAALCSLAQYSVRVTVAFLKEKHRIDISSSEIQIVEVSIHSELDAMEGILVHFKVVSHRDQTFESYFKFKNEIIRDFTSRYAEKLARLEVGLDYDQKEQIFRQYHRAIGQHSEPTLVLGFNTDEIIEVIISWISPSNTVESTDRLNISVGPTTNFLTPTLPQPLSSGKWTVRIQIEEETVAIGSFFVFSTTKYG